MLEPKKKELQNVLSASLPLCNVAAAKNGYIYIICILIHENQYVLVPCRGNVTPNLK